MIGNPVILHQRRWFRGTWSKRDGNVNNEEKRRGIRKVYMVKKTGTDGTSQKSRDRLSKSVITNWKMKKSVCAVENIDRNRQTTKNSIEVINSKEHYEKEQHRGGHQVEQKLT